MADEQTGVSLTPEQQRAVDQQKLAKQRMESLKQMVNAPSVMEQFKNSLKENSGAFVASMIDLYNGSTDLQACEPKAVVFEALKAASLKLPINKSIGHAYILAYKGVPTFVIGYKGLIQLAMRTGYYKFLNADEVFEGEFVRKNKLTGEFDLNGERVSDTVVGYFAYFELLNGFSKTIYMTVEEVRTWGAKYSPAFNQPYGPWKKEFSKMAIKTMLRNLLSKWGYLTVELASAIAEDGDYSDNKTDSVKDIINAEANKKKVDIDEAELVGDETGDDAGTPPPPPAESEKKEAEPSAIKPNTLFDESAKTEKRKPSFE